MEVACTRAMALPLPPPLPPPRVGDTSMGMEIPPPPPLPRLLDPIRPDTLARRTGEGLLLSLAKLPTPETDKRNGRIFEVEENGVGRTNPPGDTTDDDDVKDPSAEPLYGGVGAAEDTVLCPTLGKEVGSSPRARAMAFERLCGLCAASTLAARRSLLCRRSELPLKANELMA
ncbi:hypothetical protein Vafri_8988 [Volvox africanus]|uniref:Uncharacterized protein n=1 Tax=Volvox africanus TaxID=51714 RepID=A0A8J4EZK1_9CHLO|nr:hypothetical protein Vafri_8988 [Volvox africanus]